MTDTGEAPVLTPLELAQVGYDQAFAEARHHDLVVRAITQELIEAEARKDAKTAHERRGALVVAQSVQIEVHIATERWMAKLLGLQSEPTPVPETNPQALRLVPAKEVKQTKAAPPPAPPATAAKKPKPSSPKPQPPTSPPKPRSFIGEKERQLLVDQEARLRQRRLARDNDDETSGLAPRQAAERPPVGFREDLYEYLMAHTDIHGLGSLNRREVQATWDVVQARKDKPLDFEQRFAALFKRPS